MKEKLLELGFNLLPFAVILLTGGVVSAIFFYFKKRDLFGGFIGGMVIGILGAVLGAYVLDRLLLDITRKVLNFLVYETKIDIIAAFIGAWIAVYIMNRVNHDKKREKF